MLIQEHKAGQSGALEQLIPLLYDELYQVAKHHMRREYRKGHTFSATALVNETYLKLVRQNQLDASHRNEFIAIASRTMRNILVDHARAKKRLKRGAGQAKVEIEKVESFLSDEQASEVLELDAAIERLSALNERAAQVVQYRFYGGLTLEETAEVLGISPKTVHRAWTTARAWLRKEISQELS